MLLQVVGIPTNLSFLSRLASHPSFFAGNVNTDFIKEHHQSLFPPPSSLPSKILAQAALVFLLHSQEAQIHEGIALAGRALCLSIVQLFVFKRSNVGCCYLL